jgi:hypothetical protein
MFIQRTRSEEFKQELERLEQWGAPHDLIQRLQAFGLTSELSEALRGLGFPADYVAGLDRRFLRAEPTVDKPDSQLGRDH